MAASFEGDVVRILFLLLALLGAPSMAAADSNFKRINPPGQYAVGLRVVEQYDFARGYRGATDPLTGKPVTGERARPIQTLIWYPAAKGSGRDVTVEALEPLFNKKIDGFSVIFHLVSYASVGLSTLQSRATAGLIDGVFVFCLPGSNGAVRDGWDKVISAQLDSRHKPCNMVELMPRLLEQ